MNINIAPALPQRAALAAGLPWHTAPRQLQPRLGNGLGTPGCTSCSLASACGGAPAAAPPWYGGHQRDSNPKQHARHLCSICTPESPCSHTVLLPFGYPAHITSNQLQYAHASLDLLMPWWSNPNSHHFCSKVLTKLPKERNNGGLMQKWHCVSALLLGQAQ